MNQQDHLLNRQNRNYCFGGLQTPQGVYPREIAFSNEISCCESFRYLHPARWYFSPESVMYTTVACGTLVGAGVGFFVGAAVAGLRVGEGVGDGVADGDGEAVGGKVASSVADVHGLYVARAVGEGLVVDEKFPKVEVSSQPVQKRKSSIRERVKLFTIAFFIWISSLSIVKIG